MSKPAAADMHWTLEELSAEVELLLRKVGLLRQQGDGRVSAAPDGRTVRYYATLGLLDKPELDGRVARYGRKQLLQLVAIKALQAEGLGLADIQSRLYSRGERELQQLADQLVARAQNLEPELPPIRGLSEVLLAPGLKLVAEEDFQLEKHDLDALQEQFRAALAAIVKARKGRGSKP